jgi:hypothetical protein
VDSTHRQCYDASGKHQSLVAVVRYDFSGDTVFSAPEEWTRANFIAYILSMEADPLCNLLYYDSVTVRQDSVLWAAEAMTEFYSFDSTVGDLVEYIRFTASGNYGWELYAIGPMADMDSNIAMYATIIERIHVPESGSPVLRRHAGLRGGRQAAVALTPAPVNALGRSLGTRGRVSASQIAVTFDGRFLIRGRTEAHSRFPAVSAKKWRR